MVSDTVKRAFKILEPRRTKERKEEVIFSTVSTTKLGVIDPSHELVSQKFKQISGENVKSPYMHTAARHSNPELHMGTNKWSSSASVASFDGASVSSLSIVSPTMEGFDDDLDMLEYDSLPRNSPLRRQSTGSNRAKSQQKLAKILGWNQTPQWKVPRNSQSAETLVSPSTASKSPFTNPSPSSWHTDLTDASASDTNLAIPQRRRSSSHRSNSIKSTSSKADPQPYDYQMRQFLTARPYPDVDKARPRNSFEDGSATPRSSSPRSASHNRSGSGSGSGSGSNPNVHKPLPTTPSFPPFAPIHPLSRSSFNSTATPISRDDDEYSPILELSAEEASVLLSQPEPHELPTETVVDRVELPTTEDSNAPVSRVRSKSPTQPRSGSASGVADFGPGHTLSVIEEEPWTTEDLAQFKVFELPATNQSSVTVNNAEGGTSCPGLSPSSSMSSRKLRAADSDKDAELEDKSESIAESDRTPTQSTTAPFSQRDSVREESPEGEGEEIIVIYDHRVKSQNGGDMNGRSFLSLDEDTEEEETDTEETVRQSYRSSIQQSVPNSARNSMRGWPLVDGDEKRNRRTSAETTKTAYTTTTERTFVDPDFTGDLAKNLDWL